ncbi:MAG TPA: ABC transporter permease [Actinomycetota bacterium]|jgi:peptide/nickel transport system permease protein|nr:ABC transporter permease [Actinomycetota bacterium]
MTITAPGQAAADAAAAPVGVQGRGPWQLAWERLRRDPVAVVSAATLVLITVAAVAAPLVAHAVGHGPDDQYHDIGVTTAGLPVGPSRTFLLGTDNLGRDLLVRILYGARISLLVGVVATVAATVAGVVVGLAAGYLGGAVDVVLARFMDMVLSFPYLLLAIALVSVFGSSLTISMLVIAFFSWAAIGRVVRGQALSIREKEYVEASWSIGSGPLRVMFVDILPNLLAPVLVLATLLVPAAIVFEATLSFLGLGVPPPTPTWGGMLSDSLGFYQVAWWFPLFPGLALLATTLAFNLLGDSVRDALDPAARRAGGGDR